MSEPTNVIVTLDLDAYLRSHRGYDRDGEPVEGPATLEDILIDLVADKLVDRLVQMRGNWDGAVRERVNRVRDEIIAERVTPLIDEALAGGVQRTNAYGEPTGEPTTLRDVIIEEAKAWLHKPARDSYGDRRQGQTHVGKIIHDQVDRTLTSELKAAVDAAKAEVIAAVQARGAEVLAKTIAQMAGGKS